MDHGTEREKRQVPVADTEKPERACNTRAVESNDPSSLARSPRFGPEAKRHCNTRTRQTADYTLIGML